MARIVGNNRDNRLRGTGEDDSILGRGGDDRIWGRDDDDRLRGGGGNDRFFGGDDQDVLDGGRGNDRMTGGDDGDRFVFRFGRDVITDFRADDDDDPDDSRDSIIVDIDFGDVIDLRDMPGIDSFRDIRDVAHQRAADAVLRFSDRHQLTIENFRVAELDREDFLF
jgi:hypothetical protein